MIKRDFSRDCTKNKESFNNNKRHHAHTAKEDETTNKICKREKYVSNEAYVPISALTGTISHGINDWFLTSGESKYMMGYKESFVNMSEHESPHKASPKSRKAESRKLKS